VSTITMEIAVIVSQTPAVVLIDDKQREAFYAYIEREVAAFVPDTTTEKGRKEIASMAFKVTKTKTAIDAAGKQLNEDARAQINAIDAERRACKEYLGALATNVRQPLTDWEEAEEKRIEWCRSVISSFKAGAIVTLDDTAESVRDRGAAAWNVIIDPNTFGDMTNEAEAAKDMAVATLKAALARLTKEEADRAELEKLRAEAAKREEADRAAAEQEAQRKADEEAKAEAARQAELAEQRRIAPACRRG